MCNSTSCPFGTIGAIWIYIIEFKFFRTGTGIFEPVQVFYNRYKFQMLILLYIVLSYFSNATIFEVVRVMFF